MSIITEKKGVTIRAFQLIIENTNFLASERKFIYE